MLTVPLESDRVQQEIKTDMLKGPLDRDITQTAASYNVLMRWHERFNELSAMIEKSNYITRWD